MKSLIVFIKTTPLLRPNNFTPKGGLNRGIMLYTVTYNPKYSKLDWIPEREHNHFKTLLSWTPVSQLKSYGNCSFSINVSSLWKGRLRGLVGSALDHRSLPSEFEYRRGHIWMVLHLWLCFITFGGLSAHLAYDVHKRGCNTSIIIIPILEHIATIC